ncbi:GNAT family N-acetyltransferase [Paenibacillus sp. 1781tsa1]|uniref:GNAT family N-acetyltransferase n=1 Tax=Paenibacillus sp. 1781tsa1 TaxID=2953810 RepID=UPI00209F34D3|nr:GNAT family N-acetyltransferase [Paenibacillus sp. 1781tsa1]MCP1182200.1 GNAT family N-acetyltransferase [Paenibacillus sp. 1781tsa1]
MYSYKMLDKISTETLHQAFVDAFSDYQVKMDLPFWKFQQMLQRRGYHPEISMGAFKDGIMVGFVINGLRSWNGKATAYDLGTGVVQECRRQGVTSHLLLNIRKLLKEKNIAQYLLEVIQSNESAAQLYSKQNFKIQREFSCFQLEKDKFIPKTTCAVECVERIDLEQFKEFWDVEPSWQNSIDSIYAVPEVFSYVVARQDDKIVGYGIIDQKTGDIPQLAVNPNYRGKGIASSILTEMVKRTESPIISVLNVESHLKPMGDFLLVKSGFTYHVGQYEMLLKL